MVVSLPWGWRRAPPEEIENWRPRRRGKRARALVKGSWMVGKSWRISRMERRGRVV